MGDPVVEVQFNGGLPCHVRLANPLMPGDPAPGYRVFRYVSERQLRAAEAEASVCLKCRVPHDGSQWATCEHCSEARTKNIAKLLEELAWALSVIEHEVKPPESCGACGTPNAACDGTCADAHYWAEHMRAIRSLVAPIESEKPAP